MQYRGDGLDAVDQPRAGTHHERVGVDRPDRHAGQRPDDQPCLLNGAGQVETARGDQDQLRLRRGDVSPARLD